MAVGGWTPLDHLIVWTARLTDGTISDGCILHRTIDIMIEHLYYYRQSIAIN